jgi:Actin like proteins N terminal domain
MSHALPLLVAVDVGNVNTKLRRYGGTWEVEPSLVRMAGARQGFSFTTDESPVRPLVYLSGPAGIERNVPYLVGRDAQRAGSTDVALIGSAELRVSSSAYFLLHLFAIIASLPPGMTTATIAFASGLPVEDDANPRVKEALRQRLTGRLEKGSDAIPHMVQWGETDYSITIVKTSFVPQPIGAVATLLFSSEGRVQANGALLRQRYALDIGGGTTDFTGRKGLELIPGTEGGIRIGVHNAAEAAAALIQRRFPRLRHLDAGQVLTMLRTNDLTVYVGGEPHNVHEAIDAALHDTASAILAQVLPRWERTLAQGEVLLFGGGGQLLAGPLSAMLSPLTRVTLLPNPLFRVVDGIERLARHRMMA